ncbi:MAG: succinate dehydrogenase assembly factor 2 [Deltaproteobacteria bacterium]|nr:succinate dehydrogenase assembly factor 2 [Deltaproteobacteria bacterium]MBW2051769.1 succinate dehydrogenase assembly factor 2 [Deltaproteobacteria bacterium]MBW2140376.1 succinate dehydrogenase assembly factor 2 [Deltaproteobacteria bacterium]MBW2322361.1 succinate dehydrogenase assembly factor 2 [Deltaproteobacteria bacterium]
MDREKFIRRLRYQASRRASLELELMLGRLVCQTALNTMSDEELSCLDELFELDEMTLQTILLAKGPRPEGILPGLWEKILRLVAKPSV